MIKVLKLTSLPTDFHGKKARLTGVSTGRVGNLHGMEHLTNILNYLQVVVFLNRLLLSSIHQFKGRWRLI
ncbi:MAG: hypothetical protein IPL46_31525 [Saprospiraceae bacterium]|nr:hypothetical protein [Saprospiraceae bacterium]